MRRDEKGTPPLRGACQTPLTLVQWRESHQTWLKRGMVHKPRASVQVLEHKESSGAVLRGEALPVGALQQVCWGPGQEGAGDGAAETL